MSEYKIIDIPDLPDITLPEKIDVTDPCYSEDTQGHINDIPVKPGKYRYYAKRSLEGGAKLDDNNNIHFHVDDTCGDSNILEILIAHTDVKQENLKHFEYVGTIEVGSMFAGFFPAPFETLRNNNDWREFRDKIRDIDRTRRKRKKNKYESIKNIPIEDRTDDYMYDIKDEIYASEPIENAFFTSCYEIGYYTLEGIKENGIYVALRLVFIDL